jgi:anti-anti-sigma regulatory factor
MDRGYYAYKSGRLTVIGFDCRRVLQDEHCATVTGELLEFLSQHSCEILVVDLMDVPIVNSWILGVLAAIRQRGIRVEIYHPSEVMDDMLAVSHLDRLLHVRHRGMHHEERPADNTGKETTHY